MSLMLLLRHNLLPFLPQTFRRELFLYSFRHRLFLRCYVLAFRHHALFVNDDLPKTKSLVKRSSIKNDEDVKVLFDLFDCLSKLLHL